MTVGTATGWSTIIYLNNVNLNTKTISTWFQLPYMSYMLEPRSGIKYLVCQYAKISSTGTRHVDWQLIYVIVYIYVHVACMNDLFVNGCVINIWSHYYLPRRRRPGTGDIATPPSVCPSVTFSFRTVTQKKTHRYISQNFAGMCTMSWGCVV